MSIGNRTFGAAVVMTATVLVGCGGDVTGGDVTGSDVRGPTAGTTGTPTRPSTHGPTSGPSATAAATPGGTSAPPGVGSALPQPDASPSPGPAGTGGGGNGGKLADCGPAPRQDPAVAVAVEATLSLPSMVRPGASVTGTLRLSARGGVTVRVDPHVRVEVVAGGRVVGGTLVVTADARPPAAVAPGRPVTRQVTLVAGSDAACRPALARALPAGGYAVVADLRSVAPAGELVSAPAQVTVAR